MVCSTGVRRKDDMEVDDLLTSQEALQDQHDDVQQQISRWVL